MLSLQLGELPAFRRVVGKLVIRKDGSGNNVSSHVNSSTVGSDYLRGYSAKMWSSSFAPLLLHEFADVLGNRIGRSIQREMAAINDVHLGLRHIAAISSRFRRVE
jgi:hypothetical protein